MGQRAFGQHACGLRIFFGAPRLGLVQAPVSALPLHQRVVGPDFDNFSAVHHHQSIGLAQGGQAVRNGNGGAALHQVVQRLLDFFFRLGVHGRSGFVEDQDARINQQRAGNADALALTARQPLAAFSHQRVVAMRQAQDEFVRMGGARRRNDLGARGLGLAVGDVLGNGAKEQKRLLQHEADVAPVVGHRKTADVGAIQRNGTIGDVIKAADQVHQRALARTAVAHQSNHLARADVQVQILDDGAAAVAKTHAAQRNGALHALHAHRVGRLGHVADVVQDVKNAFGAGRSLLRDRHDAAHGIEPAIEAPDVGDEGCQHTHGDLAF